MAPAAGLAGPAVYLCIGDGCRDEIVSIDIDGFRASAEGLAPRSGVDPAVWAELSELAIGRIGGRLRVEADTRDRLLGALAPNGHVTVEAGGTATRIGIALAQQHQVAHVACFHGASELLSVLQATRAPSPTVSELSATGSLPTHLIVEISDQKGAGSHRSDALGRLSIEVPEDATEDTTVVDGANRLIAAVPTDVSAIVVCSAVSLTALERLAAELTSKRPDTRLWVELGEAVHSAGSLGTTGTDPSAVRRLGPTVTISMNEPTWIGLTGSADLSDESLAATYASWSCEAMVVHRETDATVIRRDPSSADLACLRRGVATASLFAEWGTLPSTAEVAARMERISGAVTTWRSPAESGRPVWCSRVAVPVCRRPSRTVGLGDAFAAGFLVEMGARTTRSQAPTVALT